MKNFKEKTTRTSYLLATLTSIQNGKPGQNQTLTQLLCILTVNKLRDEIELMLSMVPQLSFWRIIYA